MTFKKKINRILATLSQGKVPIGMQVDTANPGIIEILAYAGFDFYMLDMEHSRTNPETMENCIRAADAAGITTVVRVVQYDPGMIRHAKEAGAQGIIVPHVETPQDMRKIIDAVRYASEGKCGVCPTQRAANYSSESFVEYTEYSNLNTMIIPLLEDKSGFENAEDIFTMLKPGVDAVGTGMGDLAFSLTEPGQKVNLKHPYVIEAAAKTAALSKKTGVPIIDMAFSFEAARETLNKGTKILLFSIDQFLFYETCRDIVRGMRKMEAKA